MSAKIAKTLARQKEKIASGSYYEAHQQLRVIASRHLKTPDYPSAASILSSGAILLLHASQGGSGGDLSLMLLRDVYTRAPYPCTPENNQRLISILTAFPATEPTRKRFITELLTWSCKHGPLPDRGDPQLQHAVGALLASEGDAYEAERHLLLGTPESSIPPLVNLHYNWYATDSPHLAGTYASRSVLPLLVLGNLAAASSAYNIFTSRLTASNPQLLSQSISSAKSETTVFPSLPLLNFLALLLLACQRGEAAVFRALAKHYAVHLKEMEGLWAEALANVGEVWFGIRIPRGGNPLLDMMGSMFFGGGGGGGAGQKSSAARSSTPTPKPQVEAKKVEAPPTMDLD